MLSKSIPLAVLALGSFVFASGCSRQSPDVTSLRHDAPVAAPARADSPILSARAQPDASGASAVDHVSQAPLGPSTRNATQLIEDPEAGKRAEAQWRQHLEKEEEERQVGFDRRRLKEHRALIRRFNATRARVQAARTPSALAKVKNALPAQLEQLRQGIAQVDPWGVTSRLLPDYKALAILLADKYSEAKADALGGNPAALSEANADFNARLEHLKELLEEAEESEETY